MHDIQHDYRMLTETAKICPDANCKKIISQWAIELQPLIYENQMPIIDITEDELTNE